MIEKTREAVGLPILAEWIVAHSRSHRVNPNLLSDCSETRNSDLSLESAPVVVALSPQTNHVGSLGPSLHLICDLK